MFNYMDLIIAFFISLITSFLATYLVKKFSIKIGAVDFPNQRKIHTKVTPRLGGLAIFIGATLGALYLQPAHENLLGITLGALVIIIIGALDDRYTIRPLIKLTGQLIAAGLVVNSGLIIERVTLPFFGIVEFSTFFGILITILWIVGITNAINLLDGLDGLATGVTTIALSSIFVMGIIDTQVIVVYLCAVLIGANLGFLPHNFYPAKIYMGDTGSNFLGYMIAVLSIVGLFKEVAFFSFIIPVIVLAVPIFDTLTAIVRRAYNKENIMMADNKHLHYQLIEAGYSHRKTVLVIYAFSALFGILAILFSFSTTLISLIITVVVIILLHIFAELAGLVMGGKRPVVDRLRKLLRKMQRSR